MDPATILVDNLRDALSQVTQYVGLGLVAAISARALEQAPTADGSAGESTDVSGFPVKMPRHVAQLVLLGVYFVAGLMAYVATQSVLEILPQLSASIRGAVCTQASIVTSAIGYRIVASLLPILFVLPVLWRQWRRVRAVSGEDSKGLVTLVGFSMVPYLALGASLLRVQCAS